MVTKKILGYFYYVMLSYTMATFVV